MHSQKSQLSQGIENGENALADATTIREKKATVFAASLTELTEMHVNVLSREMTKNPVTFVNEDGV